MADDLRDLMRGEADAGLRRFSDEDFAGEFGSHVVGRVKRRRAVRSAAVGSGTLVAVGALVVGGLQLPRLGSGVPGGIPLPSQCTSSTSATPYAFTAITPGADGSYTYRKSGIAFTFDPAGSGGATAMFPDGTSTVALSGASSGSFVFELHDGSPVVVVLNFEGNLEVTVGQLGATVAPLMPTAAPRVVPPIDTVCGPTSPAVTEATSPFACGAAVGEQPYGTDRFHIPVVRQVDRTAAKNEFDRRFGTTAPSLGLVLKNVVWATATGAPAGEAAVINVLDPVDPARTAGLISQPYARYTAVGMSFVAVSDGKVVATVVPAADGSTPGVVLDRDGATGTIDAFLVQSSALTPCAAFTGDLSQASIYVVAGYATVQSGTVGTPVYYAARPTGTSY